MLHKWLIDLSSNLHDKTLLNNINPFKYIKQKYIVYKQKLQSPLQ